jgi:hypothetical protein
MTARVWTARRPNKPSTLTPAAPPNATMTGSMQEVIYGTLRATGQNTNPDTRLATPPEKGAITSLELRRLVREAGRRCATNYTRKAAYPGRYTQRRPAIMRLLAYWRGCKSE